MYKRIKGKKFSRTMDQRRAFMRSLAANLILQEKIETTTVRAKQTAALVEKLITRAKKNDLAAKRILASMLPLVASRKLVDQIAPRFKERNGGYTRVTKIGQRIKDGAPMAIVELLDRPVQSKEAPKAAKKSKEKKAAKKEKAPKEKVVAKA